MAYVPMLRCTCGAKFWTWEAMGRHYRRAHVVVAGVELLRAERGREREPVDA